MYKLFLYTAFACVCFVSTIKPSLCQTKKQIEKPQNKSAITITPIAKGWANNSINVVPYRKNSLVTFKNTQYTAYYDSAHYVVLAKRKLNTSRWEIVRTQYKGDVDDAHNSISIMVDGDGYLHLSWDHHSYGKHLTGLNYCKSVAAGSLKLSDRISMSGLDEDKVTYPEFYKLPNGDLLFFFRDGESGNGNVILNSYSLKTKKWTQVQHAFIDGENLRNPYWQIAISKSGVIHLSWTWRETPDAASNHDICYAKSSDGGVTWSKSNDEKYVLPIKQSTAEYVKRIPRNSELINQTSMSIDDAGTPYISTYWKENGSIAPQYHLIYLKNNQWISLNLGFRQRNFSLSGGGTKGIPISRPQVITWKTKQRVSAGIVFRDEERGNKVSIAICKDIENPRWDCLDLSTKGVGLWEPTYDSELWGSKGMLHLFLQKVEQKDNDGKVSLASQMISVLEWKPSSN